MDIMETHMNLDKVFSTAVFVFSLFALTTVFTPSAHAETINTGYVPGTTANQLAWHYVNRGYYNRGYYNRGYYRPVYYNRGYYRAVPRCVNRCFTNRYGRTSCARTCY